MADRGKAFVAVRVDRQLTTDLAKRLQKLGLTKEKAETRARRVAETVRKGLKAAGAELDKNASAADWEQYRKKRWHKVRNLVSTLWLPPPGANVPDHLHKTVENVQNVLLTGDHHFAWKTDDLDGVKADKWKQRNMWVNDLLTKMRLPPPEPHKVGPTLEMRRAEEAYAFLCTLDSVEVAEMAEEKSMWGMEARARGLKAARAQRDLTNHEPISSLKMRPDVSPEDQLKLSKAQKVTAKVWEKTSRVWVPMLDIDAPPEFEVADVAQVLHQLHERSGLHQGLLLDALLADCEKRQSGKRAQALERGIGAYTYWRKPVLLGLRKAHQYTQAEEVLSQDFGIPAELLRMILRRFCVTCLVHRALDKKGESVTTSEMLKLVAKTHEDDPAASLEAAAEAVASWCTTGQQGAKGAAKEAAKKAACDLAHEEWGMRRRPFPDKPELEALRKAFAKPSLAGGCTAEQASLCQKEAATLLDSDDEASDHTLLASHDEAQDEPYVVLRTSSDEADAPPPRVRRRVSNSGRNSSRARSSARRRSRRMSPAREEKVMDMLSD